MRVPGPARSRLAQVAMVIASVVLTTACDVKVRTERQSPDSTSSITEVTDDSVVISRERFQDLTGDGNAERLVLAARGGRLDSLRVRLEIRSPADSVLYASSWNSRFYFQYDDRDAMSDSAADAKVRRQLDNVLADTAFRVPRPPTDTVGLEMMRDAIRFDIATNEWRRTQALPPGDALPVAAHDSINALAARVDRGRIDSLVDELRGRRAFTYFAGGEVTYSIAWSDREKRFVTIFSCC